MRRIASLALSLWFIIPTVALANGNNSDELPPNTNGRSGGSRGCTTQTKTAASNTPALTLLAPSNSSNSVSVRPTFAWWVSEPGFWQMEFRLYQYDGVSQEAKLVTEIKDPNFKSSPGIVVLPNSKSIPELSVGQKYLWQVELICDPSHPSANPFAEAEIEIVQMPQSLKAKLANTNNAYDRASLYAKAGLWYDALGIVLTVPDPKSAELKFSLLDRVVADPQERLKLRSSEIHKMQR